MVSKNLNKHEKSKHATDLKGLCLYHDNAGTNKCKLVQDFMETETVVHNPPFSQDMTPCDFVLFTILKNNYLQTSILASTLPVKVLLFSVHRVYAKASTCLHSESVFQD